MKIAAIFPIKRELKQKRGNRFRVADKTIAAIFPIKRELKLRLPRPPGGIPRNCSYLPYKEGTETFGLSEIRVDILKIAAIFPIKRELKRRTFAAGMMGSVTNCSYLPYKEGTETFHIWL